MDERERERQRAGLAWALGDLDGLLARGIIPAGLYEELRRDYEARLRWLAAGAVAAARDAPMQAALPLAAPATEPGAEGAGGRPIGDASPLRGGAGAAAGVLLSDAPPPAPPAAPRAARPPGDITGLWINLALFLGAFFVVMASLIFVRSSWAFLGAGAKAALLDGFTTAFIAGGLACLRLPRLRPAGQTFLAIGAILLPLDIAGLYTLFLRPQGLSAAATLAFGAGACALLYGALALAGIGRAYAVAMVVAAVAGWGGMLAALAVPGDWLATGLLPLAFGLLAAGRLAERTPGGRARFGGVPAWGAQALLPAAGLLLAVAFVNDEDRRGPVTALTLATLFYTLAALTQRASWPRALHATGGALALGGLGAALAWLGQAPLHGYAIATLAASWLTLAVAAGLWRAGASWMIAARAVALVSWLEGVALVLPWGFFVRDGRAMHWCLIFGGVLAYWALTLWRLRRPWMAYPLAGAGALLLFHALRIGPSPGPYGYAWAYTLAAFAPVILLQPLRRGGARRAWDRKLVVVAQVLAVGATGAAIAAGNRFQIAAVLWLFVAAGAAIAASERGVPFLLLPNVWGLGAVAALVALSGAGTRWTPSFYAGVGLLLALGLQGWRGVPPERRGDWFTAHRWTAGLWATGGAVLGLWFIGAGLGAFLESGELLNLVLDAAYGPVGLAVTLCGAALAADAVLTLRRPTGYSASAVFALAALLGIARITPNNPQAYAVPLGLYLLVLSVYVAYEQDLGPVRMPAANALLGAAITVILGTTLAQAVVHPWRYIFLGLAEGLLLLGLTAFLRRKYGVALTLLFLTMTTLRAVFDAARALPNWATIGLLGLLLLAVALLILLRRDRLEGWGGAMLRRWGRLT